MDKLDSKVAVAQLIKENEIVLLYFGSESCNVCTAIKPKVQEILKAYTKIIGAEVDVEKSMEVAAAFNIFTIPALLLFIEGKEILREARHISIGDIDSKIERYYKMLMG
ncbi:thioredoxin family protein [Clostridium thermarum]|uniref:thioredoxin family protein n=1 Tax=Clostridium thermarum TaxID=1716543 RepID=UPI00111CEBCD|nr:thioredoxin family protein [Clostridium thermarum]